MGRAAVFTIIFLVVWGVFTAVFAAAAPKDQVRLMPKWVWVIACVILPFFGGLLYLMVGRPVAGGAGSGTGTGAGRFGNGRSGGRARPGKVVAPDDDPRFLRDLEKRLREQAEREKQGDAGADGAQGGGAAAGGGDGADSGPDTAPDAGPDAGPDKPKDS